MPGSDRAGVPAVDRRVGDGSARRPAGRGAEVVFSERGTRPPQVDGAISRAARFLMDRQDPSGFWCGELEADTTLESDTVKMWHLLGRVQPERRQKLIRTILRRQLAEGGWPIYALGPAELNASVKAYVALRLAGLPAEDPALQKARPVILHLGGLERINSFEKTYLALLGLYPWRQVPALPPEVVLFPRWLPFNIYEIAYWSRTILVPLAVLYAMRPRWAQAPFTVDELWVDPKAKKARITNFQKDGTGWRLFFLAADRFLKWHEGLRWKPFRRAALREADRWMTDRLLETDGLGAIYPAMINAVFALKALGHTDGDPAFERSVREVERLELPDGEDGLKLQPCFSPIWDTGLALYALGKANQVPFPKVPGSAVSSNGSNLALLEMVPDLPRALEQAATWLEEQEVRIWGDWRVKNPGGEPGGWAFEFRNPFYPDVDDTAQVLLGFLALRGRAATEPGYPPSIGGSATGVPGARQGERPPSSGAFRRGLAWILSMQNRDGGWSSFDKNNDRRALNHFPFADHNAMLDPSCPDITGRILELLSETGVERSHPAVRKAVAYLRAEQESDGTWFGRWSVAYIYGTWLALRGLKATGEPMESMRYQQAGRWLISRQNGDGGWGESCRSYDDPSVKGRGASTASQTAWALMGLMSLDKVAEPAFRRGVQFLLDTQKQDGSWDEDQFTGTGFPRVFYLKYHLYRAYFPMLALVEAQAVFRRQWRQ
ncbi:MAG: terpene cyclase/mutase family protein [Candidatus Omnitrophica bacterium]|nr:terpene cyclase/mutase family protein [Candidatus Omnitrophota bacterium]